MLVKPTSSNTPAIQPEEKETHPISAITVAPITHTLPEQLQELQTHAVKSVKNHKLTRLNELSGDALIQMKQRILDFVHLMCQEPATIMDLDEKTLEDFLRDDLNTGFSVVSLSKKNVLKGIMFARQSEDMIFNKSNDSTPRVTLEKLAVAPNYRRQGLARCMLQDLAQRASGLNLEDIRVLVYKDGTLATSIYTKYGFNYVDKEKDEPYDAWLLNVAPSVLKERTKP